MNTKTVKPKSVPINDTLPAKNGRASNGSSAKAAPHKKSMYEKWIEKYGVDDSESGQRMLELWQIVYDRHNKPKP